MAGYSTTPLLKKLGIREDFRVQFVRAPANFPESLGKLPVNVAVMSKRATSLDLIVVFVTSQLQLEKQFSPLARSLKQNGMLWVAWPKKSSGVETDLHFESVQKIGLKAGLVDVKICAIDETWSGLKFVYRLIDRKLS